MATASIPDKDPLKRVRRKPKGRTDFVDINEALSNFAAEEVYLLRVAQTYYVVVTEFY